MFAGSLLGYTMCHIGADYFINALLTGIADATANITSGKLAKKFTLLVAYRALALTALICIVALHFLNLHGQISYFLVSIAAYCIGACLNLASATMIELTPAKKLNTTMF